MKQKHLFIFLFFLVNAGNLLGQVVPKYSASNVQQRLEKLNTLGTALYIAAHPDDENTQLIAYLANGMHLRTGYLAATRGDGGQNLIGPEIREKLGVIRTQELLAARKIAKKDMKAANKGMPSSKQQALPTATSIAG